MADDDDAIRLPATKKIRLSFAEHIDVIVGEEKRHFTLHKNKICNRSEFFKAACSDKWKKPEEQRSIQLLDDGPDVFDIYLHCLYENEVDVGDNPRALPDECDINSQDWVEHRLINVYIPSDRLRDVTSANMIIDCLKDYYVDHDWTTNANFAALVANSTIPGSPLRKMFLDSFAREANATTIQAVCEDKGVPVSFYRELLTRIAELRDCRRHLTGAKIFDSQFLRQQTKCRYHQHDELHPACDPDHKQDDTSQVDEDGEEGDREDNEDD